MIRKNLSIYLKFFLVLIFTVNLSGASLKFAHKMNYEIDYNKALQKAKDLNKPIMMVISTNSCPWCRKLENQTLKKDMVNDIVSKEFIPLTLHKDKSSYPKQFFSKVVPTVFFINPNNEKVYHISYGYKNKKEFSKIIKKVSKEYKSLNK